MQPNKSLDAHELPGVRLSSDQRSNHSKLPDVSGACFSFLCMIHCIVTPWIGPLLIFQDVSDHTFHHLMIAMGTPFTVLTIVKSLKKHMRWFIGGCLVVGWTVFFFCEVVYHSHAIPLQIIAGCLISVGHLISLRSK